MKYTIPETFTEEEFVRLLKQARNSKCKLAYVLGFYQGLRISEILALKKENIDIARHTMMVKQAKGKKDRNIPLMKKVIPALRHLPVTIKRRTLQDWFKKDCVEVFGETRGKLYHMHSLRHSGATWLHNVRKWNIRQVQQFLGHSDIGTTEKYTHVTPEDLIAMEWGKE